MEFPNHVREYAMARLVHLAFLPFPKRGLQSCKGIQHHECSSPRWYAGMQETESRGTGAWPLVCRTRVWYGMLGMLLSMAFLWYVVRYAMFWYVGLQNPCPPFARPGETQYLNVCYMMGHQNMPKDGIPWYGMPGFHWSALLLLVNCSYMTWQHI